jgi:hypothetical protein
MLNIVCKWCERRAGSNTPETLVEGAAMRCGLIYSMYDVGLSELSDGSCTIATA